MIASNSGLSIIRQCRLLGVASSSFYIMNHGRSRRMSLMFSIGSTGFSPTIRSMATGCCKWRCCAREFPSDAGASGG